MPSTASSRSPTTASNAARAALEALAAAILAWALCPVERRVVGVGLALAWAASSASTAWIMRARERSPDAFWRAFGGGMAIRMLTLVALVVWAMMHPKRSPAPLLLSYAFGVFGLLLLEYRHIKIKK